jgi:hypothetical protein
MKAYCFVSVALRKCLFAYRCSEGVKQPDGMGDLLESRDEAGHRREGGSASLLCRL